MSLIVAGTVRVPPENIDRFRPHMKAMMQASRAEDGCMAYGYAEDVAEPGLIHVFEHWRSGGAGGALQDAAHGRVARALAKLWGFRPTAHRL